jgi:hypothetical protein
MVEQTLPTSETITHWSLASNQQRTVSHTCMKRDCLLVATCPDYLLQAPSDSHVGLYFHIVWCNMKCVCDTKILETYSNSASKNTSETDKGQHLCWTVLLVTQENDYDLLIVGVVPHLSLSTGQQLSAVQIVTIISHIHAQLRPSRTQQELTVLSHLHKTQLSFSPLYF